MEKLKSSIWGVMFAIVIVIGMTTLSGAAGQQISTACTSSMIGTFTPCLNFITGSSGGATAPTAGCCESLKSLMNGGMGCACLILTANVPLPLFINRTLSLSLPRACNMPSLPLQCNSAGTPLPAPGPVPLLLPPPPPPPGSSSLSPIGSKAATTITPALAPADGPTTSPRIRPVVQPSVPSPSLAHFTSPSLTSLFSLISLFFSTFMFH